MPTSLVFVDTEIGNESEVLQILKGVDGVVETYLVYGVYDIVAKITAETLEKLRDTITSCVRQIDNVLSTNTLFVIEET